MDQLLTLNWDRRQIQDWLKEDIPSFDVGGYVVGKLSNKHCSTVKVTNLMKQYYMVYMLILRI